MAFVGRHREARRWWPPAGQHSPHRTLEVHLDRAWSAAAERGVLMSAGSRAPWSASRHGDDDLAACVSLLHVAQALGRVGERVRPVEDRYELPGLDEPGEGEQLVALLFVRDQSEPLSDETVDHDRPKNGAH